MLISKNFLTREASYKPSYFTSWIQSGPLGTALPTSGPLQNSDKHHCNQTSDIRPNGRDLLRSPYEADWARSAKTIAL